MVGAGYESFWLGERLQRIWSIYWWKPNEAHNGYLEVFLNLGLMGVALLAVLMATGYRNIVRTLRRDPDSGTVRLAYFVAAVVYNFTEAAIRTFQPIWVVFVLMTMALPEDPVPHSNLQRPETAPLFFKPTIDRKVPVEGSPRQAVECTKQKSTIPSNR